MKKKKLQMALECEREVTARLLKDCECYRNGWEDADQRVREFFGIEDALNIALSLTPSYTSKFCPKCATAIEDRRYVEAGQYLPEYLVWTCKCGYEMFTRTTEDCK